MRFFCAAFAALVPLAASAVVATTSKATMNATDGAWSYVGRMGGASAVAIDAHHVLTAAHVGASDFLLGGLAYHASWTATDPSADLRIVAVDEALPGWYGLAGSVKKGASVTMVGYGQGGAVNAAGNGYALTGGGTRRAGVNTVSSLQSVAGYGPTIHSLLGRAGDAVLGMGDSGGGWFVDGELVGISSYTFSTDTRKAAYGWAKRAYYGSGAVDLTNAGVRSWIDREMALPPFAPQAVPEPSALAALAIGAIGLMRRSGASRLAHTGRRCARCGTFTSRS